MVPPTLRGPSQFTELILETPSQTLPEACLLEVRVWAVGAFVGGLTSFLCQFSLLEYWISSFLQEYVVRVQQSIYSIE